MVTLVTSDCAVGMTNALLYATSRPKSHRTNFSCIQTDKRFAVGDARMSNAGLALGKELKSQFIRVENQGLLFEIDA
ncbi:MAG: hypothetical protein HY940_01305 [Gammaproteobacteria bacterium]|nr:hypothetical protein [Gammaproteobacteria bacterium]